MKRLKFCIFVFFVYSLCVFTCGKIYAGDKYVDTLKFNNEKSLINRINKLKCKHEGNILNNYSNINLSDCANLNDFAFNLNNSLISKGKINITNEINLNKIVENNKILNTSGSGMPWWAIVLISVGATLSILVILALLSHK